MNVFKKIKEAKSKAMDYRDKVQQQKAIRTAEQLKELKKQRIAKEGRVRIYEAKEQEEMKLKKANMNLRKRTPAYRVADAIKSKLKESKKSNRRTMGAGQLGGNFVSKKPSGKIGTFNIGKN